MQHRRTMSLYSKQLETSCYADAALAQCGLVTRERLSQTVLMQYVNLRDPRIMYCLNSFHDKLIHSTPPTTSWTTLTKSFVGRELTIVCCRLHHRVQ